MGKTGELKYKVSCMQCGREFTVPDISSPVPKHPPKGQPAQTGIPYIPCVGSGVIGRYIETVVDC